MFVRCECTARPDARMRWRDPPGRRVGSSCAPLRSLSRGARVTSSWTTTWACLRSAAAAACRCGRQQGAPSLPGGGWKLPDYQRFAPRHTRLSRKHGTPSFTRSD
eukprot:scaffold4845_cov62-Phaeocystis_antarctica.AAC.3